MDTQMWNTIEASRDGLELTNEDPLCILPAASLTEIHVPPFPPSMPALILNLAEFPDMRKLREILSTNYDAAFQVRLVRFSSQKTDTNEIEEIAISELSEDRLGKGMTHLFLPALEESTAFEAFQEVVARLRAPDGCPWDLKQTHKSLRSHLLSETYEVLSALDDEDVGDMCEEFGDLLLQIVLHAQIAMEAGEFRMKDVVQGIHRKIVTRHPHVFGELNLDDEKDVLQNWERLKAAERAAKNGGRGKPEEPKGMLDGVPLALPALIQTQEYCERVERVGITCLAEDEILRRIHSLAGEISTNGKSPDETLLRLVFLAATLASRYNLDAEALLREANTRVRKKVQQWEARSRKEQTPLSRCVTPEEIQALWNLEEEPAA